MILSALAPFLFILGQWGMGPGPGTPATIPPTNPTKVQSAATFNFSSSVSLAYTSNIASGDLLIAVGWVNTGSASTASVSDTKGNTWALAPGSGSDSLGIWYCLSANSSGADTATLSGGGGNWYSIHLMEFSGSSTAVERAAGNSVLATTSITVNGTGAVTGNDLVIFGVAVSDGGQTFTTPTGYTSAEVVAGSFGLSSHSYFETAYQTSGTPTATTTASSANNLFGVIAAFKM